MHSSISMEAAPYIDCFRPSAAQLIESFLRPKIAGELHHPAARFFRDADVYSAAPDDLVADRAPAPGTGDDGDHGPPAWYFFSPVGYTSASRRTRKSRTVAGTDGKGRWHTEVGRKRVEGTAGGYMSKFSYQEKTSSGTTKPGGWLMVEYSIDGDGCDIVIAKIYKSPRRSATKVPPSTSYTASSAAAFTMSLMTDTADALLHPVTPCYTYFANHDNASQAMVTRSSPTTPPPLLAQGTGQYPAGQHDAAAAPDQGAGHYYPGAAPGQGAGHPMVMDDIGNDADWAWLWNQKEVLGHADHSLLPSHHMVPSGAANVVSGQNQTMLDAAYDAYAPAKPQHLTPDVVFQPHIASTSGGGLPNYLELDHQFALDDPFSWDYNTYFA